MSEMVERVARAIDPIAFREDASGAFVHPDSFREYTMRQARAAIQEMIPIIEEIPLTGLIDTSDKDLARIWSFAAESQRGAIIWNMQEAIKENA